MLGTFVNHGYIWPEVDFVNALKRKPDLIAGQRTNTDPDPSYLGRGINICDRYSVNKVRTQLIVNAKKAGIAVVDEPDPPGGGLGCVTYAQFASMARSLAAALDNLGIGLGKRVARINPDRS